MDKNKIAIREISIRAIQKLSDLDQQTIVGGPHFNLTNGDISFIFHYFFVHSIFARISPFFFNFDLFPNQISKKHENCNILRENHENMGKYFSCFCLKKKLRRKSKKKIPQ